MGDRANIKLKESTGDSIYVYMHWSGHEAKKLLRDALRAGRSRWDDEQYLHRFIITEVCKSSTDTTGFGVSTYRGDNERDVYEVDASLRKVSLLDQSGWFDEDWSPKVLQEWTFEEFVA